MRPVILWFLALLLLLPPASAPAATLEQVLAAMDKSGPAFRDMTASIKRVEYVPVLKENTEEQGAVRIKRLRPGSFQMLIEIAEPAARTVSFEKSSVKVYYPKMLLVQEYDIGKMRSLVDGFLLLGFGATGEDLKRNYALKVIGEERVAGETATRLELVPKSASVAEQMKKAELWITADGHPVQQKVYLGSREMTITYTSVKINNNLPDSALQLQLPPRVKREKMQ